MLQTDMENISQRHSSVLFHLTWPTRGGGNRMGRGRRTGQGLAPFSAAEHALQHTFASQPRDVGAGSAPRSPINLTSLSVRMQSGHCALPSWLSCAGMTSAVDRSASPKTRCLPHPVDLTLFYPLVLLHRTRKVLKCSLASGGHHWRMALCLLGRVL